MPRTVPRGAPRIETRVFDVGIAAFGAGRIETRVFRDRLVAPGLSRIQTWVFRGAFRLETWHRTVKTGGNKGAKSTFVD